MCRNKYIGQESGKGTSTHTVTALSLSASPVRDLEQHRRHGGDRYGQAGASLDSRVGEEFRGVGKDAEAFRV